MVIVGELLGLSDNKKIWLYFKNHYLFYFPNIATVKYKIFNKQATNLWCVLHYIHIEMLRKFNEYDLYLADGLTLSVCHLARSNSSISISKQKFCDLVTSRKMSPEEMLLDYKVQGNDVVFKNFTQLIKLSDKLVVPIKDFFEDNDLVNGVKVGRGNGAFSRTIEKNGTKYYTYNHLATTKTEPNLMSLRVELHCKDKDKVVLNAGHGSKEIIYVTKGRVLMDWETKEGQFNDELAVGDSAYVSPHVPHSFMALEDNSELIAVNY